MEKDENVKENETINESEITIENTEGETSNIQIADDVVAIIAGKAVSDAPGVYAMAGGFAGGISEVLSGKKNLSKGIKVDVGEKETKIDVNIIVEYGSRIADVPFAIQNREGVNTEAATEKKDDNTENEVKE